MKIIEQSHQIEGPVHWDDMLDRIERFGRTCYKSTPNDVDTPDEFVGKIMKREHLSVIEHANVTVRFVTDRGVTHELVRHRLAAYSQESTRYVNYKNTPMEFIRPVWFEHLADWYTDTMLMNSPAPFTSHILFNGHPVGMDHNELGWCNAMVYAEMLYNDMIEENWSPQQARTVLPNSLKTEIVMTANLREWRHVLDLRCSKAAHPQIRELMLPLLYELNDKLPVVFNDLYLKHKKGRKQ